MSSGLEFRDVKAAAHGQWPWVLQALGVPVDCLVNRHGPCPGCGGKDRFRFPDRDGDGEWYCGGGGERTGGDGFALLVHALGWSTRDALERVAEVVGVESREASAEDRERWATLKRAAEAAAEKRELGLALLQELELVVASLRRRYRGDDVAVASASREGATRARAIWGRARELGPEDAHPYLARKQVQAHGVRLMGAEGGDVLVIPMRDLGGRLVGVQFIGQDGDKHYLTGTPKRGAVHWIGPAVTADPVLVDLAHKGKRLVLPDAPKIVAVGEGYATVATVCEALGWDGAVAFDCSNLATVAAGVAYRWPSAWVVVLGDWDCNEGQEPGDPGVSAAVAAAEACGGVAIWPQIPGGLEWDWNDVLVRDSEEVLRELLAARLAAARAGMGPREREAARRARVLLEAWYGARGAA